MNNEELIDKLKKLHGLTSDSALAEHYGVDRQVVSNFKQREGANNIQRIIIDDLLKQLSRAKRK